MTRHSPSLISVAVAAVLALGVDGFRPRSAVAQDDAHGIREFTTSATWRVPPGVTHIIVELWGAGGGGGAGSSAIVTGSQGAGGGGGGGGSGSYVRASLAVTPGETLTIRVGDAGAGARARSKDPRSAGDGGDTALVRQEIDLLVARGGRGGGSSRVGDVRGGREGAPGVAAGSSNYLVRSGSAGGRGHDGGLSESYSTFGGAGGSPILGTVRPPGSFGGDGGAGRDTEPADGKPGGTGSALITW